MHMLNIKNGTLCTCLVPLKTMWTIPAVASITSTSTCACVSIRPSPAGIRWRCFCMTLLWWRTHLIMQCKLQKKKSCNVPPEMCLIDTLSDLQLNNRHVAALCVRIDACLTSCCSRNTWQINKGILALPSLLLHMLWHGRKLCLNQVRFRPISADGHAAEKLVNFDFCW